MVFKLTPLAQISDLSVVRPALTSEKDEYLEARWVSEQRHHLAKNTKYSKWTEIKNCHN